MSCSRRSAVGTFGLAAGWTVVGLLCGATLLLLASLFPLVLVTVPAAVFLVRWLDRRSPAFPGFWFVLVGLAAIPLFIAYTNRHGPGVYCHDIGSAGRECGDEYDPQPWWTISAGLLATAVIGPVVQRLMRRSG